LLDELRSHQVQEKKIRMKRFHVHVSVDNIEQSVRFYSALFGAAPAKLEIDYAKWMLEDPRINFAISSRGARPGIDHIGLQVDSAEELAGLRRQLQAADATVLDEAGANCCYARSDKHWVTDPAGVPWESFHTLGDIPTFSQPADHAAAPKRALPRLTVRSEAAACCAPGSGASCSPTTA
jgi:catechol 2,3-dioxygenase-like lactoylglutathione lyase family enzyme